MKWMTFIYRTGRGIRGGRQKVVRRRNGRTILSAIWSMSKDDSTLTDRFLSFNADGWPYTLTYVYKRKADGSGFTGKWVGKAEQAVTYRLTAQIRAYGEGGRSIIDASSQFTGNMDFAPSAVHRVDDHTSELMSKMNGGEFSDFLQLRLSSDLKTMTIVPCAAAPDAPHIFVFGLQQQAG